MKPERRKSKQDTALMNLVRFERRKGRLIVVNDKQWKWNVGYWTVTAYCIDGRKLMAQAHELVGATPDDWREGHERITPALIAYWIRMTELDAKWFPAKIRA